MGYAEPAGVFLQPWKQRGPKETFRSLALKINIKIQ
jgi:hypothetical protein